MNLGGIHAYPDLGKLPHQSKKLSICPRLELKCRDCANANPSPCRFDTTAPGHSENGINNIIAEILFYSQLCGTWSSFQCLIPWTWNLCSQNRVQIPRTMDKCRKVAVLTCSLFMICIRAASCIRWSGGSTWVILNQSKLPQRQSQILLACDSCNSSSISLSPITCEQCTIHD